MVKHFQGIKNDFLITLDLNDANVLEIAASKPQAKEYYSFAINRTYLLYNGQFTNVIQNPSQIFSYVSENFDKVVFVGGQLKFVLSYVQAKSKQITILLFRQPALDIAFSKIDTLSAQINALKINQTKLAAKDQQIEEQIASLKTLSKQVDAQIASLKDEDKLTLQRLDKQSKQLNSDINKLPVFGFIPNNQHNDYYTLDIITALSAKLTLSNGKGYYNFVNKTKIEKNEKVSYSVKIGKATGNYLNMGFCTEKGLGSNNLVDPETAYYDCHGAGFLFYGGKQAFAKPGSQVGSRPGDIVTCEANLVENSIAWLKNGEQFAKVDLPIGMKDKPIYISVLLSGNGDFVDLFV